MEEICLYRQLRAKKQSALKKVRIAPRKYLLEKAAITDKGEEGKEEEKTGVLLLLSEFE